MDESRNLVIMFSDVVGYSAMMGKDEDYTLKLIQKYHQIQKSLIQNFTGTIVKEIGDGLLAYFPDSEKAVTCCIEIQRIVKKEDDLNIRIGLHRADVHLVDGDIYGDGVNIASRIEPLAEPGGIYVTSEVANSLLANSEIELFFMGKAKLKNIKVRMDVYAIQAEHLPIPSKSRFNKLANPGKKLAVVPAILIFLILLSVIITATVRYYNSEALKEEARNSLVEIEKLVKSSWRDYSTAYDLAMEAHSIIPDEPRLQAIIEKSSLKINVNTDPEGALVYIKRYDELDAPWEKIGVTPIDSVRLPITVFRWRIEKEGYETVLAAATSFEFKNRDMRKSELFKANNFFRKLDKTGTIPERMTRVSGARMPYGMLEDFLIDKYEVTNAEFKKFIEGGGYTKKEYWEEKIFIDNKEISWEEAISFFQDKTGQTGPATWENGNYPSGSDNYPVTGVSWYEARAYSRFVGKDLPSRDHWGLARGEQTFIIRWPQMGGFALFAPFSNFNHYGPVEVGSLDGITSFGAFDMAGNVNEWCVNDTQFGKLIRGGGWNSNTYMFSWPMQAPGFDRSETNGFRCIKYLGEKPMLPQEATQTINIEIILADEEIQKPVSDEIFEVYKAFYEYDHTNLNATVDFKNEMRKDWIHEKVSFDAAYNNERVLLHIFLPKNAKAPFQTVIYGPGAASFFQLNSDSIESYYEFPVFLEHFVKDGRAVIYPIIKGTFERSDDKTQALYSGDKTQQFADLFTKLVKDYRRTIDYLETREDIDSTKISFYGMSYGPSIGTILTAIDDRIKTNIFVSSGLDQIGRPEVKMINFATRVKIPTLMINGKFDSILPLSKCIEPLFQLLASPENEKKLVLYDTDHIPPNKEMIMESLNWLDQQLGPVKR